MASVMPRAVGSAPDRIARVKWLQWFVMRDAVCAASRA